MVDEPVDNPVGSARLDEKSPDKLIACRGSYASDPSIRTSTEPRTELSSGSAPETRKAVPKHGARTVAARPGS